MRESTFLELHSIVAKNEALNIAQFRDVEVGIGATTCKPPTHSSLFRIFEKGESF